MGTKRAALILMKISDFDRTPPYFELQNNEVCWHYEDALIRYRLILNFGNLEILNFEDTYHANLFVLPFQLNLLTTCNLRQLFTPPKPTSFTFIELH